VIQKVWSTCAAQWSPYPQRLHSWLPTNAIKETSYLPRDNTLHEELHGVVNRSKPAAESKIREIQSGDCYSCIGSDGCSIGSVADACIGSRLRCCLGNAVSCNRSSVSAMALLVKFPLTRSTRQFLGLMD